MQLPPHFLYKKNKQTKLKRKTFGSISGLTEKLDYIQDLGVESIWLSPIYEFGGVDYGNDIIDHKKIDPLFGTEDDFEALLREVDKRGEYYFTTQKHKNAFLDFLFCFLSCMRKTTVLITHSWHPNHQNFVDHQYFFLTKFC